MDFKSFLIPHMKKDVRRQNRSNAQLLEKSYLISDFPETPRKLSMFQEHQMLSIAATDSNRGNQEEEIPPRLLSSNMTLSNSKNLNS